MNRLHIVGERWPDVTEILHYVVNLHYEGCVLTHDDIYLDDLADLASQLKSLEKTRKGHVILDGGYRFNCNIEATPSGGLDLKFAAMSGADFPGELTIEGKFSISGEFTAQVTKSLIGLLQDGTEFST